MGLNICVSKRREECEPKNIKEYSFGNKNKIDKIDKTLFIEKAFITCSIYRKRNDDKNIREFKRKKIFNIIK